MGTFADAGATRIREASHEVQEDAFEILVPELVEFLQR